MTECPGTPLLEISSEFTLELIGIEEDTMLFG